MTTCPVSFPSSINPLPGALMPRLAHALLMAPLLGAFLTAQTPGGGVPGFAMQPNAALAAVNPLLEGDTKVALTMGTFDSGPAKTSWGTVIMPRIAMGVFSESKAPTNLKQISLAGYSPKSMGSYGRIILCKAEVDGENRKIETKDTDINDSFWKELSGKAKLTQSPDGSWAFVLSEPLEQGHYLVTFLKFPQTYWDFDVNQ